MTFLILLIWLIHQQFLFHGGWTLRTPPPSYWPMVSSSEATLLTSGRMFTSPMQRLVSAEKDDNAADNEIEKGHAKPIDHVHNKTRKLPPKVGNKIVLIKSNCTSDLFEMHIELIRNFRGIVYAKDFPFECRARGSTTTKVALKLPTSGCGVRCETHSDGNLEFSVKIMLQMDEKLRQSTDILRTVRCVLPQSAMGMTLFATGEIKKVSRNGRMHNANEDDNNIPVTSTSSMQSVAKSPRIRIWLELGGPDGSGTVEVGQATTLTVRAILPGTIGVRVVDCAALDGLGESTQQLLDPRGCPIDEQAYIENNVHALKQSKTHSQENYEHLYENSS